MSTEENQDTVVVDTTTNEGEDSVKLSKSEYEELLGHKTTVGSLKREMKDLKKSLETKEEKPQNNDELSSLQARLDRQTLKSAGLSHEDDVELARKTAEKLNMSLDEVVEDDYFLSKLKSQQDARANEEAVSNVKGDKTGGGSAKSTAAYWLAKGTPPTPSDVPDAKTRRAIVKEFISAEKKGGASPFYNG